MPDTPTIEPECLTAGDSASWEITDTDYPASSGWAMTYAFRRAGFPTVTITPTGSGAKFTAALTTSNTNLMESGVWYWQRYVTKDSERITRGSGRINILANYATADAGFDPRSMVKRTLDAIEATLSDTASREERQLVVDGMSLEVRDVGQLIQLRDKYQALYQQELNSERLAQGRGSKRKILTRFPPVL